jgi:hypothetical protein
LICRTICFERLWTGALVTSWFQAVWSAADFAFAWPVKSGKTEQPPTTGAAAALVAAAPAGAAAAGPLPAGACGLSLTAALTAAGAGRARAAVATRAGVGALAASAGALGAAGAGAAGVRGRLALLGRRSVLEDARTAALGTGPANRLTLGRADVGARLGRAGAARLAVARLVVVGGSVIGGRVCGGRFGRGAAIGGGLRGGRLSLNRGRALRRGRRAGSVAERSGGLLLLDARGSHLHVEAGAAQDLQRFLAGYAPLFRYLVDALLCHSRTKSMVS